MLLIVTVGSREMSKEFGGGSQIESQDALDCANEGRIVRLSVRVTGCKEMSVDLRVTIR